MHKRNKYFKHASSNLPRFSKAGIMCLRPKEKSLLSLIQDLSKIFKYSIKIFPTQLPSLKTVVLK